MYARFSHTPFGIFTHFAWIYEYFRMQNTFEIVSV